MGVSSLSPLWVALRELIMNEIYKEYAMEYPEELEGINALKANASFYELEKTKRAMREIAKVEKWRVKLDGEDRSGC